MGAQLSRGKGPPALMYGTAWKEARTEELTRLALQTGFRSIDTANQRKHYFEAAVGAAVRRFLSEGHAAREDLFLQTKFTYEDGQDHRLPYDPKAALSRQVGQSFESSLEHLQVDYVDAYLLHGPRLANRLTPEDDEVWQAMEALHGQGRVRFLGISNVSLAQLKALVDRAKVAPAFVQNRCYARNGWDREIRAFCASRSIVYQGFSLLTANRRELEAPAIRQIALKQGCTPEQVVFRFALAVGMLPLTGTSNAAHMREDLAAHSLDLEAREVEAIERISG